MFRTGESIDNRYLIGRPLGDPASGRTFEAWDRFEKSPCVIKLLPEGTLPELQPRFELLSSLLHPGLPRLQRLGPAPGGGAFLTEELLPAVPFDGVAWDASEPALLLDAAHQALMILEFLHRHGLTHRNLQPSHLLVAAPRPFEGTTPRARAQELRLHGTLRVVLVDADLLQRGGAMPAGCSPAYLAPEALAGQSDARSDLYSLAVVLFEALGGQLPFPDVRELLGPTGKLPAFPSLGASEPLNRFLRRLGATRRDERLQSASEAISYLEQSLRLPHTPPRLQSFRVAGRQAERAALGSALERLRKGSGSFLVLEGPQGSGKNRLLDELRGWIRPDEARLVRRVLTEQASWAAQLLGPRPGPSLAGKSGLELASLVVRRLVAETKGPTLLFCSDLHHGDSGLDETLSLLSRSIEDVPLLFVGTSCRPLDRLAPHCRLQLQPLDAGAVASVVADATLTPALRQGFVERIASVSKGQPLFVLEALDLLARSGWLSRRLGRWSFEEELPADAYERIEVERAEELFQRRLDGMLPEEIRALAAIHALQGNGSERSDLAQLLGEPAPAVAAECFERLASGPPAWAAPTAARLLCAAAYARLPVAQRAQLHDRAFELLEPREASPQALAWHLVQGSAPREALPRLLQAADRNYETGALRASAQSLETAVALLEPGPDRSNCLERLADRLMELGENGRAEQLLRQALNHPMPGRALKLARVLFFQRQLEAAHSILDAIEAGEGLDEIDRLHLLGQILFAQDQDEPARAALHRAEQLARRHGERARLGRLLIDLGNDRLRSGELEEALDLFKEALGLFRAEGMAKMQAVCLNAIGLGSFRLQRWEPARISLSQSIELQEGLGSLDKVLVSRTNLGQLCAQTGRWDEAEKQLRAALEAGRRIEAPASQRIRTTGHLALLLMRRDASEEAFELLEGAERLAAAQGLELERATILGLLGELHLLERRDPESEQCLKKSLELARGLGAEELRAESLRRLAELLFEQGWSSDALSCCREARAVFHQEGSALEAAQCDRLLGKIFSQQGELARALDHLEAATSVTRRLEARYELGLTLLSRGAALSKSGFEARAIEAFEEAILIFRELGAPRDLHHAEAALRSLGAAHELVEVRHLKLLLSVVGRLNRSLDLKQVLVQILDCVLELTGASRGLLLLEDDTGELDLQIARSQRHEELDPGSLDISKSVVQRVRAHRRSIVITDVNDNAMLRQRESVVRLGLRSVMCVPLIAEGRMLGVIYVDAQSTSDSFYTRTDLGLLEAFAAQAALAIEQAKLHAQLKQSYAELQDSKANLEAAYTRLQGIQLSLSQTEKMTVLGHLASGIAHELNQPLTYLTNIVELNLVKAEERLMSPELRGDLKKMFETIEQMAEIVRGIHRYSKKTSTTTAKIPLREPLEDALRILEHQLATDGIHVIKLLEPGIEVWANRNQLTQVFINLLVNARDAMAGQPDRRLTIETTSEGESVRIRISDTGCGIDPRHMEKIFEPFFTTKSEQRGTGLGLSVVKDIVQQHKGTISLQSQLGVGTHVFLHLSLRKPS